MTYGIKGLPGLTVPSLADLVSLGSDFFAELGKRNNREAAKKAVRMSFDGDQISVFLDRFKTRLDQNAALSEAFYKDAYESYKDKHFFNLGEFHYRFKRIDPYAKDTEHFTTAQHKKLLALFVDACWHTFIDSSGVLPCPALVWDKKDTANRNHFDRNKNTLHITSLREGFYEERLSQEILDCILSHSIDLAAEGSLSGGFGSAALAERNKVPEHVADEHTDVTRAEMQDIICRKASGIFLDSAERAMREHLFTDIEDHSLYALNSHQRVSLLKEVHPVGTCYDTDGDDPKYKKSFFASEGAKNAFILRVNANCPMDPQYMDMYYTVRENFLNSDAAANFRSQWGLFSQNRQPQYQGEGATKLVEQAFAAIEQEWRNAAKETVVLTDQTQIPVYFGLLQDKNPYTYYDRHSGCQRTQLNDTVIDVGGKTYRISKKYREGKADQNIRLIPHFKVKSHFSTELYIQQGQYGEAGTYTTQETKGYVIHIPYAQNNWFWQTKPDDALAHLGWFYIHALEHRVQEAYKKGDSYCGAAKATFHPDNPFYAYAQRVGDWHKGGDFSRLDWMVGEIQGHEREGPSQRLADNFLKRQLEGMLPPK